MDYEDFETFMQDNECHICGSLMEPPYDGSIIMQADSDEEVVYMMMVCSTCWTSLTRSLKRYQKKIEKQPSIEDVINGKGK